MSIPELAYDIKNFIEIHNLKDLVLVKKLKILKFL
jgi:hypothetical protein